MQEPLLKFYDDTGFEAQINALSKSDNHKIMRRITFPKTSQIDITKQPNYKDYTIHRGIYLDTETTGLLHDEDEVIQLCMLPFIYAKNPNSCHTVIFGVYEPYIAFQEPSQPLKPIITELELPLDKMSQVDNFQWHDVTQVGSDIRLTLFRKG